MSRLSQSIFFSITGGCSVANFNKEVLKTFVVATRYVETKVFSQNINHM